MRRFLLFVFTVTLVGLGVVYGEVDAVKTGYRIRYLDIQKRHLHEELRGLELRIAQLKTPRRLDSWMQSARVNLTSSGRIVVARAEADGRETGRPEPRGVAWFARALVGTAQARSDR